MSEYTPGVYTKGDVTKHAGSPAEAVALVWDGYTRQTAETVDYRDLQAQAKELGIPANQKAPALQEAIDAKLAEPASALFDDVDPDPVAADESTD